MNYFAITALINGISSSVLGLFVYIKNRKNPINISFGIYYTAAMAFWCYSYFLWQISDTAQSALFWARALMMGAIFIPPCYLHFVSHLLHIYEQKKKIIYIGYFLASIFAVLNLTPYFVKDVGKKLFFPYWPNPAPIYHVFLLFFFIYAIYACWLLALYYKKFSGIKRNQIKYILAGTIIGYIGGSTNYLLWYDIPIAPWLNFTTSIFVITVSIAIIKYNLMDINIAIRKIITNSIITVVIAVGIICIVLLPLPTAQKIIIILLFSVLITAYLPNIKYKAGNMVNRILYREKYTYQDKLDDFIEEMLRIPEEEDLLKEIAQILTKTLGVSKTAIFTFDHELGNYILREQLGLKQRGGLRIPAKTGIAAWLKEHKEVFVKEEMENSLEYTEATPIIETMNKLEARVCVPAIKRDLMAIITLGEKSSGDMYSHIDTRILRRLGTQFAEALDYKQLEAKLREQQAEQRALGYVMTMAKELSHQFRNRLVATQTYFQMLPEKQNDRTFRDQFTKVVTQDIDAISRKLTEMMFFANLEKPRPKYCRLDIIMKAVFIPVQKQIKEKNVEIHREEEKNLPQIFVDEELTTTALSSILDNAIGAVSETGGRIEVSIKLLHELTKDMKQKSNQWLRIIIKDNGCGISKEIQEKIFKPFFTTRSGGEEALKMGLGLGLVTSRMIIEAHGGNVKIYSEENKGTTIKVDLPVTNRELLESESLPAEG